MKFRNQIGLLLTKTFWNTVHTPLEYFSRGKRIYFKCSGLEVNKSGYLSAIIYCDETCRICQMRSERIATMTIQLFHFAHPYQKGYNMLQIHRKFYIYSRYLL